jgi:hypothetical protein
VLLLVAIVSGVLGLLMAASPKVSGGMISIIAIVAAAVGIVLSILGMLGSVFV